MAKKYREKSLSAKVKHALLLCVWVPIVILFAPVFIFIAILVALHEMFRFFLRGLVLVRWIRKGKFLLIVRSDSPIWEKYFDERIVEKYREHGIVLNWSERRRWKRKSLPVLLFYTHLYSHAHTPAVLVFSPWYWPKVFRFWEPFRKFKFGQPEEVEHLAHELDEAVRGVLEGKKPLRSHEPL